MTNRTLPQPFLLLIGNVAVITEKWKITADGRELWRLFDLASDRFERRDLAAQHPEIVEELAAEWQTWADRVEALRHGQPSRNAEYATMGTQPTQLSVCREEPRSP
jgi:arylsulfatase